MAFGANHNFRANTKTIEVLQKSIKLNDKYVSHYNLLGDIYLEKGNKEIGLYLKIKQLRIYNLYILITILLIVQM